MLGIVISIVALAGVVWWALRQEPPRLPHGAAQIGALLGAIALYGVNTLVRSERWHRLLLDDGARPARADSYALTTIGYAVNNVLPARAGDAVRVVLMAPRAAASRRTVLGTIVAERLLDVGVILVLFLVVGYAVLGEVGAGSVEWIALATAAVIAAVAAGDRAGAAQRAHPRLRRADALLHRAAAQPPRRAARRDDVRDLDHRGGDRGSWSAPRSASA